MRHNPFYSIVYAFALRCCMQKGKKARWANKLYNWVFRKGRGDAVVRTQTNGQRLFCDFSHKLPFYQKEYPLYDRQLAKLCGFLHEINGRPLNIIDVGANVGDTVLNIGLKDAFYLCVEGNDYYAKYIKKNLSRYQYALERCYLTDAENQKSFSVETANGTARLVSSESLQNVPMATLDRIINDKYGDFRFDLLKVDTDGFDFRVLRGSVAFLKKETPLVFFEWDRELWEDQGEKPMEVMSFLSTLEYDNCILFDNFGAFFHVLSVNDEDLLSKYILNTHGEGKPFYYDVLAMPNSMDSELQKQIIALFQLADKRF